MTKKTIMRQIFLACHWPRFQRDAMYTNEKNEITYKVKIASSHIIRQVKKKGLKTVEIIDLGNLVCIYTAFVNMQCYHGVTT